MNEFVVRCPYCPDHAPPLIRSTPPDGNSEVVWRQAWKKAVTPGLNGEPAPFGRVQCGCGCEITVVDDGEDAAQGGMVVAQNTTPPRIDHVSVSGGSVHGGTVAKVTGHGLDCDGLVVKFGGTPAMWQGDATYSEVTVKAPKGQYTLNLAEGPMYKLTLSNVSKAFTVDEPVAFSVPGVSGVLRRIDSSNYMFHIANPPEDLDSLLGATASGSQTSATGKVAGISKVDFVVGEGVMGATSGAGGVVKSTSPLVINQPTAAFAPDELVVGNVTGATARLASAPYSGAVNVTVENVNGQRSDGSSTLVKGFTYS